MSTVSKSFLTKLARKICNARTIRGAARILYNAINRGEFGTTGARGTWRYYANRMLAWLRNGMRGIPPFSIFKIDGNSKLPFAAFSTLPDITCPGAGDCLEFCYSFLAWRYPAAFFRQLQNTLLLIFADIGQPIIAAAFRALDCPTVRLYVDGDFDSVGTIEFWFQLLQDKPEINAYGYSKSWQLLLEFADNGGQFPSNYVLNLSSGSKYGGELLERMRALPITRGEFVAVEIDKEGLPRGFARYDSAEYHRRVREAYLATHGVKAVSCPGKCGDCGAGKHLCGNGRALVPIAIGIHGRR